MRKDEVFKAANFQGPSYVPVYYFNQDQDESDIVAMEVQHHFLGADGDTSEWGFQWDRMDETMGQPRQAVITCWEDLDGFYVPNPYDPARFDGIIPFNQKYSDRFRLASLALSGFTTMTFLRGLDQLMVDLIESPAQVESLADIVFGFEEDIIQQLPSHSFDAIGFF